MRLTSLDKLLGYYILFPMHLSTTFPFRRQTIHVFLGLFILGPYNAFLPAFLAFAQRALAAAESRFLTAALSLRLGLRACGLGESERRLPFGRFAPSRAVMAVLTASRCSLSWSSISAMSIALEL